MTAAPPRNGGFTLLEMMLSISVFVMLIATAFSLVAATTELMTEVATIKSEAAHRVAIFDSCRAAFEATNLNSSVSFHHFNRGDEKFDTYLSLAGTPAAFDFGMDLREEIDRVVIAAEIQPGGFARVGVYYFTGDDSALAERTDFREINAPYLELAPRVRQFSWLFFNENTRRWEPTLDGGFPNSLVKLILQIEGTPSPMESTFHYLSNVP